MKNLFLLLVTIMTFQLIFSPSVFAQEKTHEGIEVCFVGSAAPVTFKMHMTYETYMNEQVFRMYQAKKISCENLDALQVGISSVVYTLALSSIFVSATGVGVPASVGIGVTTASLSFFNFMLGKMECEENKEVFKEKAAHAICEILERNQNITCSPHLKVYEVGDLEYACKRSSQNQVF